VIAISKSKLPKAIGWTVPKDYWKALPPEESRRISRKAIIKFLVEVIITAVTTEAVGDFISNEQWFYAVAGIVVSALLLWLTFRYWPITNFVDNVKLTKKHIWLGSLNGTVAWSDINWYQMTNIEGMTQFRALEINIQRGDKADIVPLVFKPSEIDENAILKYIEEIIPGKCWQH
jgi:hypothetical protein